jgi:hypothetical protein
LVCIGFGLSLVPSGEWCFRQRGERTDKGNRQQGATTMKAEQTIEQAIELPLSGVGDAVAAQPDKSVTEIVNRARQEAFRKEQDDRKTWSRDNPDLVCPAQSRIVVYKNSFSQAVIGQERAWDEDEDTYVIISKHYLQDVIGRLQRILSSNG